METHKGQPCKYSKDYIFCQEVICLDCVIWLAYLEKHPEKKVENVDT